MSQEESNIRKFSVVPKASGQRGDDADLCPICFGSGMEIVPGEGARPCQCRMKKAKDNLLNRLNIPKRYVHSYINNYKPLTESQVFAHNHAQKFIKDFPAVSSGLLFMGPVGIGKTHLAVAVLKHLSELGFYCYFCDFNALIKEIRESYNPLSQTSESDLLQPIFKAEVLVLDELGASKPTDWVRDTLSYIINTRYNDKKLTLFTTNYLDERGQKDGRESTEEILSDRIGVRLRSRLHEMCHTVRMDGSDYRLTFDKAAPKKKNAAKE